jgi:hypothetical protein
MFATVVPSVITSLSSLEFESSSPEELGPSSSLIYFVHKLKSSRGHQVFSGHILLEVDDSEDSASPTPPSQLLHEIQVL